MKRLINKAGRSFWIKHWLCRYQWYRRWHGGRWERWWIDICAGALWLDMRVDLPDTYRQPCSSGPRIAREDYPIRR